MPGTEEDGPYTRLLSALQGEKISTDHRLIFTEYQKPYGWNDVLKDHEVGKKVDSATAPEVPSSSTGKLAARLKQWRKLDWPTYLSNIVYRTSTIGSQFKHARLCVLSFDVETEKEEWEFEGKVWDYGDGDGNEKIGRLYEEGGIWEYNDTSVYQYEGWTTWEDDAIQREG
jgi:hypothetical protein